MNKFGLIYFQNELWLVDVHAADERVKFELFSAGNVRNVAYQSLLAPIKISCLPLDVALIMENKVSMEKFGLRVSQASSEAIFIHSVPVYYDQEVSPETLKNLIDEMVSSLKGVDGELIHIDSPFNRVEYKIVARLACHGSIRSGYPVSDDKLNEVLNNLLKCKEKWVCAHGRPTVLRINKRQIEGWFKR